MFFIRSLALALSLGALLSACTLTYLPPLLEARSPSPRLELNPETGLSVLQNAAGETLELLLQFDTVPEPDWFAVQWFSPRNEEVAAASLWLEPGDREHRLQLPPEVPLQGGLWRAVLSYQGRLVRQVSLEVGGR